jgi:hypothetical protein
MADNDKEVPGLPQQNSPATPPGGFTVVGAEQPADSDHRLGRALGLRPDELHPRPPPSPPPHIFGQSLDSRAPSEPPLRLDDSAAATPPPGHSASGGTPFTVFDYLGLGFILEPPGVLVHAVMTGEPLRWSNAVYAIPFVAIGAVSIAIGRNWETLKKRTSRPLVNAVDRLSRSYVVPFIVFALTLGGIAILPILIWPPNPPSTVVTGLTQQQVDEKIETALKTDRERRPTTVVRDSPTPEQIAKAAGDTLRAVTGERDALRQQNDTLRGMAPNPPPAPAPPRSKQTITELLEESSSLLGIVENSLVPLESEWRNVLGGPNPERICVGVDSVALQSKASDLAERLQSANKIILKILDQNNIDRNELSRLIGYPSQVSGIDQPQPVSAAYYLGIYKDAVKQLGEHPTCESVVRSDISVRFREMTGVLNGFNYWMLQAQEHLKNYRDALRKESRNAP